jgi:hypothetical protein
MDIKRLAVPLLGAALIGGAAAGVGLTAFAASDSSTTTSTSSGQATVAGDHGPGGFGGGVEGTVTAVSGSSITVSGKNGATYTVDDSSASVEKYANGASATSNASSIAVGDTVMIDGSITTASLTAKSIRDDFPAPTPPAAMGKVTAVSGSTITISGMARPTTAGTKPTETTYTVDASSATVTKIAAPAAKGAPTTSTISVSDISVGDMISVEGTANGTSITATTITDGVGFGMGGGRGPRGN